MNVEFVSANPTGPLHVGHGRQAALGDAISSLLAATGWKVSREFYYNDAGAQIENLALSVQARVRELAGQAVSLPEGGYHGEYIREIAQRYVDEHAADANAGDLDAVQRFAVRELRKEQDRDLQAFGVEFDVYFLESSLYADGRVDETVRRSSPRGTRTRRTARSGSARPTSATTRIASCARADGDASRTSCRTSRTTSRSGSAGFKRAINVQGADHHSTVTRVRVGLQALDIGIPQGLSRTTCCTRW